MKILTRICMSVDGYVTTPDGWPAQLGLPAWDPAAYGFVEFQQRCEAVLMGRTTCEPALGAAAWPWPGLDVFVLGSHRPAGTPQDVVVHSDPVRLLEAVRAANRGRDVHLIGGPRTIETFRRLGAVDELGVVVLPLLLGGGMQLTPSLSTDTALTLEGQRGFPAGAVEIVYTLG
jgi:dihydrofolate reductase